MVKKHKPDITIDRILYYNDHMAVRRESVSASERL